MISTVCSWVNIDGLEKAAKLAQVDQFYFAGVGQFYTAANKAWQQVLEELAETDGLEMSLGEDGVVTLTWEAGDEEGVQVVDGIELVQEPDMVVQRFHEERA
ncbi:DUF1654 domain-containing protein [Pseudomonas aeruginosa]|uniref:DUF1654 domain-containing protein n=1 Tax=Pseudomonas aeruginosa TaxID=287 RepID=UPI0020A6B389|nr:DUF1654 domain-containing protein [Pseudomonas aeruginosa]